MNLPLEGRPNRVPDFLLAGAARGGTTTLYDHLSRTAGVFMSREKEPHFFLSLCSRNVEAFLESFDAVKVLLFDDFRRDSIETLTGLFEFLGLEAPALSPKTRRLGSGGIPRSRGAEALSRLTYQPNVLKSLIKHFIPRTFRRNLKNRLGARLFRQPILVDSLRRELTGFFREDIIRLERVIGRDLGIWLGESSSPNRRPSG